MNKFMSGLDRKIDAGESALRETLRALVRKLHSDLFARLDDCSADHAFLEPFAFTYFARTSSGVTLDQLLGGYLSRSRHPSRITAISDAGGRVYIPRVGWFSTAYPKTQLELVLQPIASMSWLEWQRTRIETQFEPSAFLIDSMLELCLHHCPSLDELFFWNGGVYADMNIGKSACDHANAVNFALAMLTRAMPAVAARIMAVVRRVVIFDSSVMNSFAAPAAHGSIFLNAHLGATWPYFLEDIVHQSGHVMFRAVTGDGQEYFTCPAGSPMRLLNGHNGDNRPLYEALYGIFTLALITEVLNATLCNDGIASLDRHELEGRLVFALVRFAADLKAFAASDSLSPEGREFMRELVRIWRTIAARHGALLAAADLSNQGYNFSYQAFATLNPVGVSVAPTEH